MHPRVLIGSNGVPGHGGGATASYALFRTMRKQGCDVAYANLFDVGREPYFLETFGPDYGNPEGLDNVHNCAMTRAGGGALASLTRDFAPELILAIGQSAAYHMKLAAPDTRLILLTTGCEQAKACLERGEARDAMHLLRKLRRSRRAPILHKSREHEAVRGADLVVFNSELIRELYSLFYASESGRFFPEIVWMADWIHGEALEHAGHAKPFTERDIDVLFLASRWERVEKNYPLVRKIVSRMHGAVCHVVGATSEPLVGAVHHGVIQRREDVFRLLGRAKSVVCPSLMDAAPGVLFEGSAMGCNVIASENCGNWRICHEALLPAACRSRRFRRCIRLALTRKHEDNVGLFLRDPSYGRLLGILSSFGRRWPVRRERRDAALDKPGG